MFGSDSDTVRVDLRDGQTVELNAEEVAEAIDDISDENAESIRGGESFVAENGATLRDEFAIHGDAARDSDLFVVTEEGASSLISGEELRDRAEDAIDEPFEDYLRNKVFISGTYVYDGEAQGDLRVAEHSDGSGYTIGDCIVNAVEDENVNIYGIRNGWLVLDDER